MPALDPSKLLENAVDFARAMSDVLRDPAEVVSRVKLVRRKLPAFGRGLKLVGKSDKKEVLSIGTFLEDNARERPDATALLYEDRRYTHRELNEQANRYADVFARRGVKKGDAVAIFVENRPELLFAVAGAVKLGGVAALINTRQRKHVLEHSLKLCGARLYVVGEELWDAFAEVRGGLPGAGADHVLWLPDGGAASRPDDAVDAAAELAAASTVTPAALAQVKLGDPCFYIYTSGTTGLPKAAIMSHFRWVKAAGAFGLLALDLKPTDVVYLSLPLYHNNALTVTWASAAATGAAMVIRRRFSASQFWDDVRRYQATCFCYIGELCRYLLNQPRRPDDADNPVTKIIGNGLRPDIWKAFKQRFAIDEVYEFYAASEGNIAFVNVLNLDSTCGVCPAPYAIVEYDVEADAPVRGPDGFMKRVGRGNVGLLIGEVSERYAFDGYTDKAASEKKLLRDVFKPGDVWFNSGDLMRDQGFRHAQFVDRVGDTFRWKGENVSTNEVAEVLNTWNGVAESTVYGVALPHSDGRAGMAAVVSAEPPERLDLAGLARHLREQLPPYAVPLFLRFRTELEVTTTFKQRKVSLREEAFDPAKVSDPIFVLLPGADTYSPLTPELHAQIASGALSF